MTTLAVRGNRRIMDWRVGRGGIMGRGMRMIGEAGEGRAQADTRVGGNEVERCRRDKIM